MDIMYRNLFDFSNLPKPFTSFKLIQGHLQQQYTKITQKEVNISQFASVAKYFVRLIRTNKYSIKVFQEKCSKWLDTPFVLGNVINMVYRGIIRNQAWGWGAKNNFSTCPKITELAPKLSYFDGRAPKLSSRVNQRTQATSVIGHTSIKVLHAYYLSR